MPISDTQIAPNFSVPGKPTPNTGNSASKLDFKPRNAEGVGVGTSFNEKNQYTIEQYSYPNDIMDAQYGYNNVIFYINVASDSKLLKDAKNATVADVTPRDRGDLIGSDLSQTQVTFGSAAGGIGTAAAGGIAGGVSTYGTKNDTGVKAGVVASAKSGAKTAGKVAGAAGLVSAVGVGAVGLETSNFSRQQKRLSAAIALHVPNQISIRYGMNWGEEDTNIFAMGAAGADILARAASGSANVDQVLGVGSAIAAAIALQKTPQAAAISASSGLALNPRKEQVFKSVDFRTFSFAYDFYPRDADEAQNVLNIIQMFKLHMHPEFKDSSNFLYIYPSEFDIYYYQGGKENMNLHRHTSCVLTEMTVNYSPQGQFTTFDNGMPTQININLNFRELALLTKEKIQDGY
jgi:hypothetical protein